VYQAPFTARLNLRPFKARQLNEASRFQSAPTDDANLGDGTSADCAGNPAVVGRSLSGLMGFLSFKSMPTRTDDAPTVEYNVGFSKCREGSPWPQT